MGTSHFELLRVAYGGPRGCELINAKPEPNGTQDFGDFRVVSGWSWVGLAAFCLELVGLGWSRCACDSVWFPAGLCWSRYVWMCGFGLVSAGLAAFVWSVWFFLPCSWVSLSFPFIIGPMSNSELDIPLVSSESFVHFLKFPLICFTFSVQCPTHELDIPYVS